MSAAVCEFNLPDCKCVELGFEVPVKPSKIKRGLVIGVLALITESVLILAFIGGLTMYDRVVDPAEDSGNILLNCHIYGDGDCGGHPWYKFGFVNLF